MFRSKGTPNIRVLSVRSYVGGRLRIDVETTVIRRRLFRSNHVTQEVDVYISRDGKEWYRRGSRLHVLRRTSPALERFLVDMAESYRLQQDLKGAKP